MDYTSAMNACDMLQVTNQERALVASMIAYHDVVDDALEIFTETELSFKAAMKADYLGEQGAKKLHLKRSKAANGEFKAKMESAMVRLDRLREAANEDVTRKINKKLLHTDEGAAFVAYLRCELSEIFLSDDSFDPEDARLYHAVHEHILSILMQDGIIGLIKHAYVANEHLLSFAKTNSGRGKTTLKQRQATGILIDDHNPRTYDPRHFWGVDWILTLKVIGRTICRFILICLIFDRKELVKEWKKVVVCKHAYPKTFDPDSLG